MLSPGELQRLSGLRFARRRDDWLRGRLAAKALLQRCLPGGAELAAARLEILNESQGMPFAQLDGRRLTGFLSISHRDALALVGWSPVPLGVDTELVEERHPAFAQDFFTPHEIAAAGGYPAALRDRWFTLAWSVKESALKALGSGLRLDTRQVEVDAPSAEGLAREGRSLDWQPIQLHVAALQNRRLSGFWSASGDHLHTAVLIMD